MPSEQELLPSREFLNGRRFISEYVAADYADSSLRTFIRRRMTGTGPRYVRHGRRVLYDILEVDRWLAAQSHASYAEELAQRKRVTF